MTELSMLHREFVASFSNESLHLIILPTEQCNFRCVYCYEDFTMGRMKPEIVEGLKLFLVNRLPQVRQVFLSWFGGEPLLALSTIEDISSFVQEAVGDPPAFNYFGEMTTNGYRLTEKVASRLSGLGIKHYQVSLDGPEAFHDTTRIKINGKGSFSQIWDNLTSIRESSLPVHVLLRLHLTPANLPVMRQFVCLVRDEFLTDPRFTVLLKAVERFGGPRDHDLDVLDEPARSEALAELRRLAIHGGGEERLYQPSSICYAARPNSWLIRANGDIGKCTVALSDRANTVGRLHPDGSLLIDNERLRPWLRGWENEDWNELGCPLVGLPEKGPVPISISPRAPQPAKQASWS